MGWPAGSRGKARMSSRCPQGSLRKPARCPHSQSQLTDKEGMGDGVEISWLLKCGTPWTVTYRGQCLSPRAEVRRVGTFLSLPLSFPVLPTSSPHDSPWLIDSLLFFWTQEIPALPSGDQHDQLLLDAHGQLISEGGCLGGDGPTCFLCQDQRVVLLTTPLPAVGSSRGDSV